MRHDMGVWIDHRQAVVVSLSGDEDHITVITSNAERHLRPPWHGGRRGLSGDRLFGTEDRLQRQYMQHLHPYYDRVVEHMKEGDSILLMGPGRAKDELKARIHDPDLRSRIECEEAADRMTVRQFASLVRLHFAPETPVLEFTAFHPSLLEEPRSERWAMME